VGSKFLAVLNLHARLKLSEIKEVATVHGRFSIWVEVNTPCTVACSVFDLHF
jgi:hypothetical protein